MRDYKDLNPRHLPESWPDWRQLVPDHLCPYCRFLSKRTFQLEGLGWLTTKQLMLEILPIVLKPLLDPSLFALSSYLPNYNYYYYIPTLIIPNALAF